MAGEISISAPRTQPFRWWFLLSWLGLDAPCVVLTWTWAIGKASGAYLSFRAASALFLVVWSIYLLDRLVDVGRCYDWQQATGRLRFGRRYQSLFLACLSLCAIGIFALLLVGIPADVTRRAMYVALGFTLHFLLFVVPVFKYEKLPGKEFGVGAFFALGAYACLGFEAGMLPLFVSVALLVAFNCLVIAAKDAESDRANDPGGASRWWPTIQRDLFWCGAWMTIAGGLMAVFAREKPFYVSVAAAFFCLTALHRWSEKCSGDSVRSLADFALFTPILSNAVLFGLQL